MVRLWLLAAVVLSASYVFSQPGATQLNMDTCYGVLADYMICTNQVVKKVNKERGDDYHDYNWEMFYCKLHTDIEECENQLLGVSGPEDEVTAIRDMRLKNFLSQDFSDEEWQSENCTVVKAYNARLERGDQESVIWSERDSCNKEIAEYMNCDMQASNNFQAVLDAGDDGRPDWFERKFCNYITAWVEDCGKKLLSEEVTEAKAAAIWDMQINLLEMEKWEKWDSEKCPAVKTRPGDKRKKNEEKCKKRMAMLEGTIITSPGYPAHYLPNVTEEYVFEVRAGKRIQVEFTDFILEDKCGGECAFDWVKVMDDGDGPDHILLDKTCSADKPKVFTSKSNKIKVFFQTDSSLEEKGWAMNCKEV